jgi:quinol monooxygenase YgiN
MIIVTGTILARQDSFAQVLKLSREHVERSRKEDGCVSHDVHTDTENPLRLFFFERWRDEEALRTHFAVPASREFVKGLRDLIVETSGTEIWRAEKIER